VNNSFAVISNISPDGSENLTETNILFSHGLDNAQVAVELELSEYTVTFQQNNQCNRVHDLFDPIKQEIIVIFNLEFLQKIKIFFPEGLSLVVKFLAL